MKNPCQSVVPVVSSLCPSVVTYLILVLDLMSLAVFVNKKFIARHLLSVVQVYVAYGHDALQ